jgi:hypothetical protein
MPEQLLHCANGSQVAIGWMALAMESDEASNPVANRLFGPDAVMPCHTPFGRPEAFVKWLVGPCRVVDSA